jgi:hypothetical protein
MTTVTVEARPITVYTDSNLVEIGVVAGGPTGPQGPQGIQGIQGIQGPQGIQGIQGEVGEGLNIVGSVANASLLPLSAPINDGYIAVDTGHLHVWNGTIWVDTGLVQGPPGPIGLESRATATFTATDLAAATGVDLQATMSSTFAFIKAAVDQPAIRTRVYISAAHRTADASRPVGTDPTGDHGLILEFISDAVVQSLWLSPAAIGYLTSGIEVPIRVDNLGTSTVTAVVTLTWLKMEA